jgi:hypothetical protein
MFLETHGKAHAAGLRSLNATLPACFRDCFTYVEMPSRTLECLRFARHQSAEVAYAKTVVIRGLKIQFQKFCLFVTVFQRPPKGLPMNGMRRNDEALKNKCLSHKNNRQSDHNF